MTRWWKCDLQVATPGEPRFDRCSTSWDLREQGGREAAADDYMRAVVAAGVGGDRARRPHNSASWVDTMVEAGKRHGITVFPGVEVTTGTGSDGAPPHHLGGPVRYRRRSRSSHDASLRIRFRSPAVQPVPSGRPCLGTQDCLSDS
jgi:hypothetical protein